MKIIAILYKLMELFEEIAKSFKIRSIEKKVNEGLANEDQTEIEKSLGGTAGSSSHNYDGMYERERKDR